MTQRLDYAAAAPNGMKALGGLYGYVAQSGLMNTYNRLAVSFRTTPEAAKGH